MGEKAHKDPCPGYQDFNPAERALLADKVFSQQRLAHIKAALSVHGAGEPAHACAPPIDLRRTCTRPTLHSYFFDNIFCHCVWHAIALRAEKANQQAGKQKNC